MSPRNINSQKIHNKMIRRLFDELCSKNYEGILVSHIEIPDVGKPQAIYSEKSKMRFCPDIYAVKDGILYLFEVETKDSIGWSLTKTELECFAAYVKKCGGYFYLVVPVRIKEKAEELLNAIEEKDSHKTYVLAI